jgi:solute carrier family 25 phosphate transporter 3
VNVVVMSETSKNLRQALAGAICASATHVVMVPLDVIKTRLQVRAQAYTGTINAFSTIVKHEGYGALTLGLGPTAVGYALQGAFKFGVYEIAKKKVSEIAGESFYNKYKTAVYITSAVLAESIASTVLCPWEALRIRVVSHPEQFKQNTIQNFSKLALHEGISGLYRGLGPILLKQVPYTVVQFVVFQHAINFTYQDIIPKVTNYKSKEEMSTRSQLGVTLAAGTVAGVTSAIASHPADTVLSKVNSNKGQTVMGAIRALGLKGVWQGVGPRCLMVGALSAGMFLIYDSVKVLGGLPTSS